ncbi:unnamed protein product [Adineta steineri]|uniref:Uncharacterized protein n=2 Tax=Adineta steineri TaxID=433720 RepID=A0A819H1K8_9BILA|nr:unnamed protein product [Adineta steineri]
MMLLLLLLFFCVPCITGDEDAILDQLRTEIALSKRMDQDHMIDFVCKLLASPEFIVASADDDFLSTILDELGFGALGVRRNTWAAKYQADPRKSATCFGTLHSVGTSDKSRMSLANSRNIIRRCCLNNDDL